MPGADERATGVVSGKVTPKRTISLVRWIDEQGFGPYQVWVVALCFLVTTFDGFDTQVIAFTGPAIARDLGLGPSALAPVITAGVAGMALGAILFGPLGDRYGRRPAVIWATLLFGLFSLAAAGSGAIARWLVGEGDGAGSLSFWLLLVFRFVTGIGMGGATPNVLALAAEFSPSARRGITMLVATLGLPVGAIAGSLMAPGLLPQYGWQGVFVVGGVAPLLYLLVLWRLLPESPHFLVARGLHRAARATLAPLARHRAASASQGVLEAYRFDLPEVAARGGLTALFGAALRRRTLGIWGVYFFNYVTWFALILYLPLVLHTAGLSEGAAARGTTVINSAALIFILPLAWYLPRLPVRGVVLTLLLAGVGGCVALAQAGQQWTLVYGLIALSGLFIGGPQIALNYLAVRVYPTALRATGVGAAIGVGRVGTIFGAALGGPLLQYAGVSGFYLALTVPLVLAALAALAVGRGGA